MEGKKEATEVTVTNKPCVCCKEKNGSLFLEDNQSICDDCAQHMNDIGVDYD